MRTGADTAEVTMVPDSCATSGAEGGVRLPHDAASAPAASAIGTRLARMPLKDGLLAEYDHETGATRRMLERLPDDRLAWKPHDKSMSLAGLGTHLGSLPAWGAFILQQATFDLAAAPPRLEERGSRAEIVSSFDEEVRRTRGLMDRTDAELLSPWSLRRGEQEMFTMPKISAFRTFVLYHMVHHRGQLSVYLRLNGVLVPAIYGPSADEGF